MPQIIEMRQGLGPNRSGSDFVTTYEHSEQNDEQDGRYQHVVSRVYDPYGLVTETYQDPLGPSPFTGDRKIEGRSLAGTLSAPTTPPPPSATWRRLKNTDRTVVIQSRTIERPTLRTEETISTYNGLGQLLTTQVLNAEGRVETQTDYVYQDTWGDQEGYLFQVKRTWNRDDFDDVVVETFDRDNVGNVIQYFPPRYDTSQIAAYRTVYNVNELNQVWHIRSPGLFQSSSHTKSTYRYFDRRGNLTNVFEEYVARNPVTETVSSPALPTSPVAPVFLGSGATFPKSASPMAATWAETSYEYDLLGRKRKEHVDAIAGSAVTRYTTEWQYDAQGNVERLTNPRLKTTAYEYDERDLLIKETQEQLAITSQYAYDGNGNLRQMTDGRGKITTWQYDDFNRLLKVTHPELNEIVGAPYETIDYSSPSPNFRHETWRAFDGNNQKLAETVTHINEAEQRWLTMRWAYSSLHMQNLASGRAVPGMTGATSDYSVAFELYDALGRVTTRFDDNGGSTNYVYDRLSRVGVVWDGYAGTPVAQQTAQYSQFLTQSNAVAYTYDVDSNVIQVSSYQVDEDVEGPSDPDRRVKATSRTVYELNGLPTEVTDARGQETKLLYDGWGRVVRRKAPDDTVVYFEYDLLSRITKQTEVNPSTGHTITSTTYDENGNVVSRIDESLTPTSTTQFEYDALDRLMSVTTPDGSKWTYTYDKSSNMVSVRDPGGTVVADTVNSWGLVDKRTITKAGGTVGAGSEFYEYDGLGRLTLAATYEDSEKADQITEVKWEYNTLSLPEKQSLKVWDHNHSLISGYFSQRGDYTDAATGLQSSLYLSDSYAFPDWTMQHHYDGLGFVRKETFWDGRQVEHFPDVEHRLNRLQLTNDVTNNNTQLVHHKYLGSGRLTSRTHGPAESNLGSEVDVSFEPIVPHGETVARATGNPTTVISRRRTAGSPHLYGTERAYGKTGLTLYERRSHLAGLGRVYRYDSAHRLTSSYAGVDLGTHVAPPTGSYDDPNNVPTSSDYKRLFALDARGNLNGSSALTDEVRGNAYNTLEFSVSTDGMSQYTQAAGLGGYAYDLNNRLTFDPATGLTYKYDYKGALSEIHKGSELLQEFRHDALGRRVLTSDVPTDASNVHHTITIPAIGAGDSAVGSKPAGEVSIDYNGNGTAAVQYTYGVGVTTPGSTGALHPMTAASPTAPPTSTNMMVLEFVAYWQDGLPYYRFRHEDQTGSLVGTTNIKGDRLAEYDYLDYGTPLWRPIKFDGHPSKLKQAQAVYPHATHPDTTVIALKQDYLKHNELAGLEVRFIAPGNSTHEARYVTAMVESSTKNTINVRDPNGEVFAAATGATGYNDSIVFDLSCGFQGGACDTVASGSEPDRRTTDPNDSLAVTYIKDIEQPFHLGQRSDYASMPDILRFVTIWIDNGSGQSIPMSYEVYDVLDTNADMKFDTLVLVGDHTADIAQYDRYDLQIFDRNNSLASQSGQWIAADYDTGSDTTWFQAEYYTLFDDNMTGWLLQPNNEADAYFPVIGVDKNARKLHVAGDVEALVSVGDTRFHLYAPPGTDRQLQRKLGRGDSALGEGSLHLFAGYRYQPPQTGIYDFSGDELVGEQDPGKLNKAGLYYVFNRVFDPALARFITPDPLAAPLYNLYEYASHRPLDLSDPAGLKEAADKSVKILGYDMGFSWDPERGSQKLQMGLYDAGMATKNFAEAMWNDPQNTMSGASYGLINAVTGGLYGEIVTPEEFTNAFGGDSSSAAFVGGAVLGEVIGNIALSYATAGIGCSLGMVRMAKILGTVVMVVGDIYQTGKAIHTGDMGAIALQLYGQALGKILAGSTGRSNCCFIAGTQVLTDEGSKNIEEIEPGDMVWSRDEYTGDEGFQPVVQTFERQTNVLVHLVYHRAGRGKGSSSKEGDRPDSSEVLTGTPEHPFWSLDANAWVPLGELEPGDRLLFAGGEAAEVVSTTLEQLSETAVYNFEVASWHTYFVFAEEGVHAVWAHNACGPEEAAKSIRRKTKALKGQGFEEHHIISNKNPLTEDHELLQLADFNLESRKNKIFLPKTGTEHPTRSIHSGRHTNRHSLIIAQKMDIIVFAGKKEGWKTPDYKAALMKLLSKERQALKAGDIPLNKNKRPWARE